MRPKERHRPILPGRWDRWGGGGIVPSSRGDGIDAPSSNHPLRSRGWMMVRWMYLSALGSMIHPPAAPLRWARRRAIR